MTYEWQCPRCGEVLVASDRERLVERRDRHEHIAENIGGAGVEEGAPTPAECRCGHPAHTHTPIVRDRVRTGERACSVCGWTAAPCPAPAGTVAR